MPSSISARDRTRDDYAVEHFGKRSHARLALTTPARRTSPGLAAVEAPRRGQGVSSPVATTDNDRSALGLAARIPWKSKWGRRLSRGGQVLREFVGVAQ